MRFASGGASPCYQHGVWLPQTLMQPKSEDRVLSPGGKQAQWSQPGPATAASSNKHREYCLSAYRSLRLLLCCCLSFQVRQTCLLVARCMRLLGSAIAFSPLSRSLLCTCCGLLVQGLQHIWTRARVWTAEKTRTRCQSLLQYPWLHPVMGFIAVA